MSVEPREDAAPIGLWGTAVWEDVGIYAVWMAYAEPYELVEVQWLTLPIGRAEAYRIPEGTP